MILWLLIFQLSSFAQELTPVVEEYCFTSEARLKQLFPKIKFMLIQSDQELVESNCLTIKTTSYRRELIQSYVTNLDPSVQVKFSSTELKGEPCRIKVEKIKTIIMATSEGSLNPGLIDVKITANTKQKFHEIKETNSIQTQKEFELAMNQSLIKGICNYVTADRYEISLEVRKDPIPATQWAPMNQETSSLKSTLQLSRGDRVELGSILKDRNGSSSELDMKSGAQAENNQEEQMEKIFLSID
jgi:hypothetical protein